MKILFSTGEKFGERVLNSLMPLLKKQKKVETFEIKMLNEIDTFDNLRIFFTYLKHYHKVKDVIQKIKPDVFVPITFSSFHEFLIPRIRNFVKKIVYVSPPQIWAWKEKRITKINEVDYLVVFFPFEYTFFQKIVDNKGKVFYFGHPLIKRFEIERKIKKEVCLLPGARKNYAKRNLNYMLSILKKANIENYTIFSPFYKKDYSNLAEAVASSGLVLSSGGFVTLESVIAGTPTAITIKVSPLTYYVYKKKKKVKYISLVNNILNREVVKEFVNVNEEKIIPYLKEMKYQEKMFREASEELLSTLYRKNAAEKIVELILS